MSDSVRSWTRVDVYWPLPLPLLGLLGETSRTHFPSRQTSFGGQQILTQQAKGRGQQMTPPQLTWFAGHLPPLGVV